MERCKQGRNRRKRKTRLFDRLTAPMSAEGGKGGRAVDDGLELEEEREKRLDVDDDDDGRADGGETYRTGRIWGGSGGRLLGLDAY